MNFTGRQTYILPGNCRNVVDILLQKNVETYKRLLPPNCEWSVDEEVYEEIRLDTEELAMWIMKRASEFAAFRERDLPAHKRIKITEEDLNNAWDAVQMEKQK